MSRSTSSTPPMKVREAFQDQGLDSLVSPWFEHVTIAFHDAGFYSAAEDTVEKQEQRATELDEFQANVRKWFRDGKRTHVRASLVRGICRLLGGEKKLATTYKVNQSTVNRWSTGDAAVPNATFEDMENRWGDRVMLPSDQEAATHGWILALNRIREDSLKQKHFLPLNREVWEMMVRAWKHEGNLDARFESIRKEVLRLPAVAGPDGANPPQLLRVSNCRLLQGWMEEWKLPFRLALGVLSGLMG